MEIGKLKLTEALKLLKPIAHTYGLKLCRTKDFKTARALLANLYCHEVQYED